MSPAIRTSASSGTPVVAGVGLAVLVGRHRRGVHRVQAPHGRPELTAGSTTLRRTQAGSEGCNRRWETGPVDPVWTTAPAPGPEAGTLYPLRPWWTGREVGCPSGLRERS